MILIKGHLSRVRVTRKKNANLRLVYISLRKTFTNANGVRLCYEDEPGLIVQAQGHCLKMRNYCQVNLVMKTIRSLNLTHILPVTCKSVMTLTFGILCKFMITRRKMVYPFISNREILSYRTFLG